MRDSSKLARRLVLLAAALAALAAAPAAQAGLHVSMTSTGLNVTTDQSNASEVLQITGLPNPEGSIGNWNVDPLCVTNIFDPGGAGCSDTNDSDCSVQPGSRRVIRCARTAPGIHVTTQGARDRIHVGTSGTDPVSIDAGDGDDEVGADSLFSDVAVGPSAGPWTALLGPGDDTYVGSQGGDFVSGDTGNDTIDPGAGSDGVSAGAGNDRVSAGPDSEASVPDAYDGGPGIDTLDYSARTTGIFAALVGTTGGAPGESDGIATSSASSAAPATTRSSASAATAAPATTPSREATAPTRSSAARAATSSAASAATTSWTPTTASRTSASAAAPATTRYGWTSRTRSPTTPRTAS